jgi:hypothetical protein
MSNWLQNATKNCCDELDEIAKRLQTIEKVFIDANDKYYQSALKTLASDIQQEEGAVAFVAAVNTDINRSMYRIAGLGHVCSATKLLQAAITKVSQIYDGKLVTIGSDHKARVPQETFNKLITDMLATQQLDDILRTGAACILNAWSFVVEAIEAWGTGQSFHDLATSIKSSLQDWAEKIKQAYSIFQQTLSNFNYLSARDLYYYINRTQGTNKPITITPYTTKDEKKGLLITIAGTDPTHWWDDSLATAVMTGAALPDNLYMSDVEHAIETYLDEHSEMHDVNITFVGYSLGGMIAQNWAKVLSSRKEKAALRRRNLHVTNVVTYGSPLMNKPVVGVQYAMYIATCDPVPLLSVYENHLLRGKIRLLIAELARRPLNLVTWEDLVSDFPKLRLAYTSIAKADQELWEEKLDHYIDRRHLYRGKIFPITDVGNDPFDVRIGHMAIVHIPNLKNHFKYCVSDELNVQEIAQTLPNVDPGSWGPTEYFGMQTLGAHLAKRRLCAV